MAVRLAGGSIAVTFRLSVFVCHLSRKNRLQVSMHATGERQTESPEKTICSVNGGSNVYSQVFAIQDSVSPDFIYCASKQR
jgi:hypothetical protein